jgi:hypothetical protein
MDKNIVSYLKLYIQLKGTELPLLKIFEKFISQIASFFTEASDHPLW